MNIIELARKNNLIKELKDIDIVEDNSIYLNEENSSYNFKYNVGDIVFVKKYNYSGLFKNFEVHYNYINYLDIQFHLYIFHK